MPLGGMALDQQPFLFTERAPSAEELSHLVLHSMHAGNGNPAASPKLINHTLRDLVVNRRRAAQSRSACT